jgi:hypothetical protein
LYDKPFPDNSPEWRKGKETETPPPDESPSLGTALPPFPGVKSPPEMDPGAVVLSTGRIDVSSSSSYFETGLSFSGAIFLDTDG